MEVEVEDRSDHEVQPGCSESNDDDSNESANSGRFYCALF